MRNISLENIICAAIKDKKIIRLRYENDFHYRVVAPYIVYRSTKDKVLLGCTQLKDESKPFQKPEPRQFEIGLINHLTTTDDTFEPEFGFSSYIEKYRNGVICALDRF